MRLRFWLVWSFGWAHSKWYDEYNSEQGASSYAIFWDKTAWMFLKLKRLETKFSDNLTFLYSRINPKDAEFRLIINLKCFEEISKYSYTHQLHFMLRCWAIVSDTVGSQTKMLFPSMELLIVRVKQRWYMPQWTYWKFRKQQQPFLDKKCLREKLSKNDHNVLKNIQSWFIILRLRILKTLYKIPSEAANNIDHSKQRYSEKAHWVGY